MLDLLERTLCLDRKPFENHPTIEKFLLFIPLIYSIIFLSIEEFKDISIIEYKDVYFLHYFSKLDRYSMLEIEFAMNQQS